MSTIEIDDGGRRLSTFSYGTYRRCQGPLTRPANSACLLSAEPCWLLQSNGTERERREKEVLRVYSRIVRLSSASLVNHNQVLGWCTFKQRIIIIFVVQQQQPLELSTSLEQVRADRHVNFPPRHFYSHAPSVFFSLCATEEWTLKSAAATIQSDEHYPVRSHSTRSQPLCSSRRRGTIIRPAIIVRLEWK